MIKSQSWLKYQIMFKVPNPDEIVQIMNTIKIITF